MDVVPAGMKDEVAKWWKVLKRRKGMASKDFKITLQHLIEVSIGHDTISMTTLFAANMPGNMNVALLRFGKLLAAAA